MAQPHDPILSNLLTGGAFETLVRVASLARGEASPASLISTRFPGLSPASSAWLASRVSEALDAGEAFARLSDNDRFDISLAPKVASRGTPGAEQGNIVTIGRATGPGQGPKGKDMASFVTTVHEAPPTGRDRKEQRDELMNLNAARYERLRQWIEDHQDEIIDEIMGVFVIE